MGDHDEFSLGTKRIFELKAGFNHQRPVVTGARIRHTLECQQHGEGCILVVVQSRRGSPRKKPRLRLLRFLPQLHRLHAPSLSCVALLPGESGQPNCDSRGDEASPSDPALPAVSGQPAYV
jgi:hypothetical protein